MTVRAYDREGAVTKTWSLPGTPTWDDLTGPSDVMYRAWKIVAEDGRIIKDVEGPTTA